MESKILFLPRVGRGEAIKVLLFGALSSAWLSSFFFARADIQGMGFALQLILLLLSLVIVFKDGKVLKGGLKILLPFLLFANAYLLCNLLKDDFSESAIILALKNIFYISSTFFIGASVAVIVSSGWVNLWGKSASIIQLVVGVFLLQMFFLSGYSIGGSLLETDLAANYQGFGRTFGQIALFSAIFLPIFFAAVILVIAAFVVVSYSSFGAWLGLILALFALVVRAVQSPKSRFASIIFIFSAGYIGYVIFSYIDSSVLDLFSRRFFGKIEVDDGDFGRYFIYTKAIQSIFQSIPDFLFGPSIFEFSCQINNCEYRHPHNIFLNFHFFFGFLGFFLDIFLLLSLWVALKKFFRYLSPVAGFFIYYAGLSMVGGDLEQNRNLFIFFFAMIFQIYFIKNKVPNV